MSTSADVEARVEITPTGRQRMRPDEQESQGLVNVDRRAIEDRERLRESAWRFTPKTRAILRTLGWF